VLLQSSRRILQNMILDRPTRSLFDSTGRRFDPATRTWRADGAPSGDGVDMVTAATWLQRESGHPIRMPVGVVGTRDASPAQRAAAEAVGRGLAAMGFLVLCGGRTGVMEAVCKGVAEAGGVSIGLLPGRDVSDANAYATWVITTGIGEARNAIIARAPLCLVAIGGGFGTLTEVAFGRNYGKLVVGLENAPQAAGVVHVASPAEALELVARCAFGMEGGADVSEERR
jgi:uncharacterized protein (TIGR00725 family)